VKIIYFKSGQELRAWFEKNHLSLPELALGYFKKKTGRPTVTWSESVDQAICFGWIDGIRRRVDDERYWIRFTPRRAKSHWSRVNIEKVKRLTSEGLMSDAGIAAYERMDPKNAELAAYENDGIPDFHPDYLKQFKSNRKAWAYFDSSAKSYQKLVRRWVMSAMQEKTRLRRLKILIESSGQELKIPSQRKWK